MSILIADSGATKTEWCLKSKEGITKISTEGLNPYYHTTSSIQNVVMNSLKPKVSSEEVEQIHFYGAGCDSKEKKQIVYDALENRFKKADIHVFHDLLGAARACFFNDAGIACILGTGSNSCLYDGEKIVKHIPSLAFILGDEGSAGYFGKKLINSYFRYEVPDELVEDLEDKYDMSLEYITKGLYDNPQKSRFIASYGAFLGEHADHPFIKEMLHEGFENFITRIVMKYPDAEKYEVRFIGSVASAHQEMIKEILKENGMKPGLFVQKPMSRLVEFHSA
jgi:N-acetylglucosamine kinase-like BadF-type ATPase